MLTKEECSLLLALRCHNCKYQFTCNDCVIRKKLEQLINEHFDNPPLQLEDIHVGMWIWDNVDKMYTQVVGYYTETCLVCSLGLKREYKPNRFYKMEVIE